MFKPGDEVVCLYKGGRYAHKLKVSKVYRVKDTKFHPRLRGQALYLGHRHSEKGRLWFASIAPSGKPCFRKVVRDEPKAADQSFINQLKKVSA